MLRNFRDMIAVGGVDPYPRGLFIAQDYREVWGVVMVAFAMQVVRLSSEEVEAVAESGHPELVKAREMGALAGKA